MILSLGMAEQISTEIMMVRPKHFGFDLATASSNSFQNSDGADAKEAISKTAIQEFDAAVQRLRTHGVKVHVIEDTEQPVKPNAVFPNNWVSFHDGQVLLYPMEAVNRRWERREDILDELQESGIAIDEVLDISGFEEEEKYLESTGSLVLDYKHKLAYACISSRTNREVLDKFCEITGFEPVLFEAFDRDGVAVYHTNVLMCIGTGYAVICADAIPEVQRNEVLETLRKTGHEVVTLTMEQMYSFAGNMLEVADESGNSILVMSGTAMKSLNLDQKEQLSNHAKLLALNIPTIEKYGGGSVRCMMCRLR